jgi:hypothetical protein
MASPQRCYLHTGEQNLLFASWPGDHLLDRAKRGDADLRRALVCVVKARTARVTVAVCEELADLDCAAFARKKFAPFVRGLFPVPLARLPQLWRDKLCESAFSPCLSAPTQPNTIETVLNKEDPRTAWDPPTCTCSAVAQNFWRTMRRTGMSSRLDESLGHSKTLIIMHKIRLAPRRGIEPLFPT